ncbi:hypothetical protein B296_00033952 [Ensete ventricosum]|uniref:Uncharacterized protein n=1 Tax=Ensete ventricosum TaxID=4639 RepID=A0A427A9N6_ENSVE|nr:hypothetical protein B296_00033952 [Ensete ventricosum]
MSGMYRSASRSVRGPLATGRYWWVMVDFDRRHPLPGGISNAATRKRVKKQGRRKRKRKNLEHHRPLMVWRRVSFFVVFFAEGRRRLRPENLGTTL